MGTLDVDIPDQLNAKLESYRRSDADRNELLERLLQANHAIELRYQEKSDDYENEVASRRIWQNNCTSAKRELESLKEQNESNPFALVLIDGDGAIFQEHLLKAGADGGSESGHLLMGEVKKHLQERHGSGGNWSVMLQIYANFEGLSRKLEKVGILRTRDELHQFARAFSFNQPLFSFVDVGAGKERADHKMKEMLRLFMFNSQCKHIIFGGCHDNGYLPNLEPFKRNENITSRMTLMQTTPAEPGFSHLGMKMTSFNSVFRNDPLPDSRYIPERHSFGPLNGTGSMNGTHSSSFTSQGPMVNRVPPELSRPTQPNQELRLPTPAPTPESHKATSELSSSESHKSQEVDKAPVPKAATVSPSSTSAKPSTYATVGRSETAPKQISIAPEKAGPPKKAVYINPYDERLDIPLPKPDVLSIASLNARIKKQKVCNNYHLLSYCPNGRLCHYSHEPKLNAREQIALKTKARDRPCGQGSSCRDPDCLSGHHCPRGEDCQFDSCIFGNDSHYIDRTLKLKYLENGEVEIVH